MTKESQSRKRHGEEFKAEALRVAGKIGVTKAARELGLHGSQIYQWRAAAEKKAGTSERESTLATENAKLKRELAEMKMEVDFLKKAAAYFAKNPK